MEIILLLSRIAAAPLVVLIWVYQKTLSPDHGPFKVFFPYGFCKFHPTCSEYSKVVFKTQGMLGMKKVLKRVLSCTPASLGGIDYPYKDKVINS